MGRKVASGDSRAWTLYSAFGLARALPEYPHAELAGAAWHDAAQLQAFTSTFGVPGYADYAELLEREAIDIVHIAAPVAEIPTWRSCRPTPASTWSGQADGDDRRPGGPDGRRGRTRRRLHAVSRASCGCARRT